MENQNSKNKLIFEKTKKLFTYLWPFSKKIKNVYNLKSIRIPRTSGRSLKILVFLVKMPIIRKIFLPLILRQAGLKYLRKFKIEENPLMTPNHMVVNRIPSNKAKKSIQDFLDVIEEKNQLEVKDNKVNLGNKSIFKPESATDFRRAYLEGKTTPVNVVMRFMDIIRSLEESAVPLRPFVSWDEKELMLQAKSSTERYS